MKKDLEQKEVEKNVKELKKEKIVTILCKREAPNILKKFFIAFAIIFAIVVIPNLIRGGFQGLNFVIFFVPIIMFVVTCILRIGQVSKSEKYTNEINALNDKDLDKMYDEISPEANKDFGALINFFAKIPEIPIIFIIPIAVVLAVIVKNSYLIFLVLMIADLLLIAPTATGKLRKGQVKDPRSEEKKAADDKRRQEKQEQKARQRQEEIEAQKKQWELEKKRTPTSVPGVYLRGDGVYVNSGNQPVPMPVKDYDKKK